MPVPVISSQNEFIGGVFSIKAKRRNRYST